MKPASALAEKGYFSLLYPYGNQEQPFDLRRYLEAKNDDAADDGGSQDAHKLCLLTWASHSKRRLYTDNFLLNSGPLLQQWALRTFTNIEDMRLQLPPIARQLESHIFQEDLQIKRMSTEEEIEASTRADGTLDPSFGKLYLPDSMVNSPAYWKQKRLHVQAIVARKGVPSLFVTVTMNLWRDEMKRLGLYTSNRSAFSPMEHKSRVFDQPDLVGRVYNQFIHAVMTQITKKAKEYFVNHKCVAFAEKLEFQARNTPHFHILL